MYYSPHFVPGKLQAQLDNMRAAQSAFETLTYAERQRLESKLFEEQKDKITVTRVAEAERKHLMEAISLIFLLQYILLSLGDIKIGRAKSRNTNCTYNYTERIERNQRGPR